MKAQRFSFTLPDELAREFRRLIPRGKRSQFIAEAIREKLYRFRIKSGMTEEDYDKHR